MGLFSIEELKHQQQGMTFLQRRIVSKLLQFAIVNVTHFDLRPPCSTKSQGRLSICYEQGQSCDMNMFNNKILNKWTRVIFSLNNKEKNNQTSAVTPNPVKCPISFILVRQCIFICKCKFSFNPTQGSLQKKWSLYDRSQTI